MHNKPTANTMVNEDECFPMDWNNVRISTVTTLTRKKKKTYRPEKKK